VSQIFSQLRIPVKGFKMSEDILKTPRSARSARRKSLFPHLENLLDSPRSVASLKLSGGSSARKSLPLGFKQEMPRQSSNNKMFVAADGDGFSPIKKSSFYGKSGGYVPKCIKSPISSTSDLENSFESKVAFKPHRKSRKNLPLSLHRYRLPNPLELNLRNPA